LKKKKKKKKKRKRQTESANTKKHESTGKAVQNNFQATNRFD